MTTFKDLNLHNELMQSLERLGFETPTPVQAQFIPEAMKGGDVMASAQTGSGKTAAFLLPAFQKFLDNPDDSKAKRKKRGPRVLILTPTRELAEQVMQVAKELRAFSDINVKSVVGGEPIMKHKRMLREVVDVLVATPGRLIDLMKQGAVHLQDVDTFVLDEADRMLDMGFSDDVLMISRATKPTRQAMLVSATLEGKGLEGIVNQVLQDPKKIELTSAKERHDHITQKAYHAVDRVQKEEILKRLAGDNSIWQAVIFVGMKSLTEKIAKMLMAQGEKVDVLHGDMRQGARKTSIRRMQQGHIRFLVATDVAARGLDIKELTHVINFDLPRQTEDYIHRIGRVGRAGKAGEAIALVSNDQLGFLSAIEKMLGHKLDKETMDGIEWTPPAAKGKGKKKGASASGKDKKKSSFSKKRKERTVDVKPREDKKSSEKKARKSNNGDKPFERKAKPSKPMKSDKPGKKSFGKSFDKPKSSKPAKFSRKKGEGKLESHLASAERRGAAKMKPRSGNPQKKRSVGAPKSTKRSMQASKRISRETGFLKRKSR